MKEEGVSGVIEDGRVEAGGWREKCGMKGRSKERVVRT